MSALTRTLTPLRTAIQRSSSIAAPALFAARPIRSLPLHARWISTDPADPTNTPLSRAQAKGGYATPYEVPLSEQAREVAADLKTAAKGAAEDVKGKVEELTQKAKKVGAKAKSKISETIYDGEAAAKDATNATIKSAKATAKSAKATAKSAKASVVNAEEAAESTAHRVVREVQHAGDTVVSKVKEGVRTVSDAVKEATNPGQATSTHPASMGLDQDSVKKSILDGPQRMPEGVGKRATSEDGKPMETGTERS